MNRKYRKTIIAGNWKMNMLASEIKPFMEQLKENLPKTKTCEIVLCTPAVMIPAMVKLGKECKVQSGGEDVSKYEKGAYTGEVSAAQLADVGAKYCIVGHSERRQYHGESDMLVNEKARALLAKGISPIICVGESLEQREMDLTMEYVAYQVKTALSGIDAAQLRRCVIAYEPIWAIGTGKTATAEQAQEVCEGIRAVIRKIYGARPARAVSILYGGKGSMSKKAVLIIMDGFGIAPPTAGNAIAVADTPNLDRLFSEYPCSQLSASGLDVGLPEGQMGNSEVGHTNIGAGRVVFQILPKMTQEIKTGKFFENPV